MLAAWPNSAAITCGDLFMSVLETYLRELRDIHAYYERVKAQCYSWKDKLADTL